MKAKLIKKKEDWYNLYNGEIGIGSTHEELQLQGYKLSLKNCQAIENGYDLYELAKENYHKFWSVVDESEMLNHTFGYVEGFQKALELMGDKKFSEEDIKEAFFHVQNEPTFDVFKQSLQQTEWDVNVEMEYVGECNGNNDEGCFQDSPGHNCGCFERRPKLDEEGCLILKRV